MNIKSAFTCSVAVAVLTALTAGCQRAPVSHHDAQSKNPSPACSSNPYLMRYGCSVKKVQLAAENGNADAQYALGYMYYYGIDTVQDRETGELWIQRSAAQGQPLAKKAWSLINSGAAFTDMHAAASGSTPPSASSSNPPPAVGVADTIQQQESVDVDKMNSAPTTAPITNYLPSYQKNTSQNTPSTSATPSASSQPAAQSEPVKTAENMPVKPAKVVAVNDPRLSGNFQPVVANSIKEQEDQQAQKSQKAPSEKMVAKAKEAAPIEKRSMAENKPRTERESAMSDPRLSSSFQPVVAAMAQKQSA